MTVLKDGREDWWVKDNAVWALGEMGCQEAVQLIMEYVRDKWKSGDADGMGKGVEALDKMGVFNYD